MIQNISLCIIQNLGDDPCPSTRTVRIGLMPWSGQGHENETLKLDIFVKNKGFRERKLTFKGEKHKEKEMYLIKSWNSNQGWFSIVH